MWMDCGARYTKDGQSIYTDACLRLIKNYVSNYSNIDTNQIYKGGCSNGRYQTLNLVFKEPNIFNAWITIDINLTSKPTAKQLKAISSCTHCLLLRKYMIFSSIILRMILCLLMSIMVIMHGFMY